MSDLDVRLVREFVAIELAVRIGGWRLPKWAKWWLGELSRRISPVPAEEWQRRDARMIADRWRVDRRIEWENDQIARRRRVVLTEPCEHHHDGETGDE